MVMSYQKYVRPVLLRTPYRLAEYIGKKSLHFFPNLQLPIRATNMAGIQLKNPIGLAAGFDKDGKYIDQLAKLGFGYITVGSVTLNPWPGNPKKFQRVYRDLKKPLMANTLGLPNEGVHALVRRLDKRKTDTPIIGSVSGFDFDSTVRAFSILEGYVDGIELNYSCPNTTHHVETPDMDELMKIIGHINFRRTKPFFVKIGPLWGREIIEQVIDAQVDGLTVFNSVPTYLKEEMIPKDTPRYWGGISGTVLYEPMLDRIKMIRDDIGSDIYINACSGILNGLDAHVALLYGATTCQIYTGMIYNGPMVVKEIVEELHWFEKTIEEMGI